jgi:hypothetical protein
MKPLPLLVALLAVSASAQDFAMPEELGAIVLRSRAVGAGAPTATAAFRAAAVPAKAAQAQASSPINSGFQGLGAAGKTGKISGPPLGGDGTYRVIQNDPTQMVFDMRTGYVVGRFTLTRDAATGRDTLGFAGQTKDGPLGGWTSASGNYAGRITYNAGTDSGTIGWQLNGQQISDTYNGGRSGSRSMTITLKGNTHTFTQD